MISNEDQIFFINQIEKAIHQRIFLGWIAYGDKLLKLFGREIFVTAEDLVHETILKIFEGKRSYKKEIELDAFIKMNIKSEFYNLLKKEMKTVHDTSDNNTEYEENDKTEIEMGIPEDEIIYATNDSSGRCLEYLNVTEGIVLLEKLEGKNYDEICNDLSLEKTNLYYITKQIRQKVRKNYKKIFT